MSDDFEALNNERLELIAKKYGAGLSFSEAQRLEYLQDQISVHSRADFERMKERIQEIRRKLAESGIE